MHVSRSSSTCVAALTGSMVGISANAGSFRQSPVQRADVNPGYVGGQLSKLELVSVFVCL